MATKRPAPPDASPPRSLPARPAPRPRAAMAALPLAIVEDVFAFLAPPAPEALLPDGLDLVRYRHQLFKVQQVCRAWHALARSLAARYAPRVVRIEAWWHVENELAFSMRTIERRGAQAMQLEMIYGRLTTAPTMGPYRSAWFDCTLSPDFADTENRIFDWNHVFGTCVSLKRLDMSLTPFNSQRLEKVLEAASVCSPRLESLILPIKCRDFPMRVMDDTNLVQVLTSALPRWQNSNGGLRQLTLSWHKFQNPDTKRQLLEIVGQTCPNLEYLRDWTPHPHLNDDDDPRDSGGGHIFTVDLETWRRVNRSFTQLVELYWRIPPASKSYFEAFASTAKPKLKDLYMNYTTSMPLHQPDHEGIDGDTVRAFFKAIPGLRSFSLVTERYHNFHLDLVTPHDTMIAEISRNCPEIESIRIQVSVAQENRARVPMITDAGIHSIARMRSLRRVDLYPVRISEKILVALLRACCMGDLHSIEISLYPVERELELMQQALQFIIDEGQSLVPAGVRPSFALRIHQTSSSKYRQHTRDAMETLLTLVRSVWTHVGYEVLAGVEKAYRDHGCEFVLRVNLPERERIRSRRLWKKLIDCDDETA